jgi:hypothetical protein
MNPYYDSLDDYNADVIAAREAYAADEAVRNGLCAVCKERRRHNSGHKLSRRCWECRRARRREGVRK